MIATLWVIITCVFFIMKVLPGSPFDADTENKMSDFVRLDLEKTFELDKPLFSQYIKYIKNIISLNLGQSYKEAGVTVFQIIKKSFKYSAIIGFSSMIVAVWVGLFFGVVLYNNNFILSKIISGFTTFGVAMPNFILAIFFVYFWGEKYNLLSIGNQSLFRNYIGAILVLSIYPTCFIIKIIKANIIKILDESYISVLRSFGVSEKKILFKYALKEVLIPVVTYIAPMFASVIMGSFAIEKIFAIPGLGKVFIDSVIGRDYYVVFGLILFYASVYLLTIFITDICYFIIDPRLKNSF